MECPRCGAVNMDGAGTCWECSADLKEAPERTSARWIPWAAMGVATLLLVFIAIGAGSGSSGGALGSGSAVTTGSVSPTGSVEASAGADSD